MTEKAWTIWFTGMHGAGKTTIADKLAGILRKYKISLVVLDGDELRESVSSDLGYSINDRNEHMKRVANICKIISDNGVLAVASVASPTQKSREYAKGILKNMLLVYVKCPLGICEKRDVKGHYKKSREKELGFENFIGSRFEEPKNADVVLNTDKEAIEESVDKLLNALKDKGIINNVYK